jgi:hypothetical protein
MKLQASVKINAYRVIDDAVDRAVGYGYRRARKYSENPSEDHFIQEIHRAVMNELCEIFDFNDENEKNET